MGWSKDPGPSWAGKFPAILRTEVVILTIPNYSEVEQGIFKFDEPYRIALDEWRDIFPGAAFAKNKDYSNNCIFYFTKDSDMNKPFGEYFKSHLIGQDMLISCSEKPKEYAFLGGAGELR